MHIRNSGILFSLMLGMWLPVGALDKSKIGDLVKTGLALESVARNGWTAGKYLVGKVRGPQLPAETTGITAHFVLEDVVAPAAPTSTSSSAPSSTTSTSVKSKEKEGEQKDSPKSPTPAKAFKKRAHTVKVNTQEAQTLWALARVKQDMCPVTFSELGDHAARLMASKKGQKEGGLKRTPSFERAINLLLLPEGKENAIHLSLKKGLALSTPLPSSSSSLSSSSSESSTSGATTSDATPSVKATIAFHESLATTPATVDTVVHALGSGSASTSSSAPSSASGSPTSKEKSKQAKSGSPKKEEEKKETVVF